MVYEPRVKYYKIRQVTNARVMSGFAVTIPPEVAIKRQEIFYNVVVQGPNLLLMSGCPPNAKA